MEKNTKILIENFENAVNEIIKEFSKRTELDFDGWTGEVGEVADFGCYFFNFSDIIEVIKKDIPIPDLLKWYDYVVENGQFINLKSYISLRNSLKYYKGFGFDEAEFHKYLNLRGKKSFNEFFNLK